MGAADVGMAVRIMPICSMGMRLRLRLVGRGVVPIIRDVGKAVGVNVASSMGRLSGVQMAATDGAVDGKALGLWLCCCSSRGEGLSKLSAVVILTREGDLWSSLLTSFRGTVSCARKEVSTLKGKAIDKADSS